MPCSDMSSLLPLSNPLLACFIRRSVRGSSLLKCGPFGGICAAALAACWVSEGERAPMCGGGLTLTVTCSCEQRRCGCCSGDIMKFGTSLWLRGLRLAWLDLQWSLMSGAGLASYFGVFGDQYLLLTSVFIFCSCLLYLLCDMSLLSILQRLYLLRWDILSLETFYKLDRWVTLAGSWISHHRTTLLRIVCQS